jgi:hypothetical protein
VLGILLGAILGAIDGGTAWLAPEARDKMIPIIVGATIKGTVTGLLLGLFALRVRSVPLGLLAGLALGFLFSFFVAYHEHSHYVNIVTAGSILGLILGYATQRFGRAGHGLEGLKDEGLG